MVAVRRASIPAEQLDCRGCSAARLARPRRAQVALPEGVPRGDHLRRVEDLPAAGARRRRCQGDNRWITPCEPPLPPAEFMYAAYPLGPLARYSPYLLLKYHCHLNVEVYKYYLKYLYTVPYRTGMLQASGPAMWVAFCKLRRSLKPALKDRFPAGRAISAPVC